MKILQGKMEQELKQLPDNSVDSIVCDPPYGLSFMNKAWDYQVPTAEQWKEAYRVLKPGGHLIAFFGSRTYHRGAVEIEDAGFDIRDQLMWVYGSGFPKSHNIGKYHAKKMKDGVCRVIKNKGVGDTNGKFFVAGKHLHGEEQEELPKSEWEGWGTALKPAHEPMVLARKPFKGSVVDNVIKHGVGGLNIDESRVGDEGRFPANFIHDGSDEVVAMFPDAKGKGHWAKTKTTGFGEFGGGTSEYQGVGKQVDNGSTARFFYVPKVSKKERNEGLEGKVEPTRKAAGDFRPSYDQDGSNGTAFGRWGEALNTHPTVKPIALMEYLIKLVTPEGGIVLDPFMGSGSTGCAAVKNGYDFIGCELDADYIEIAKARIEYWKN